MFDKFRCFSVVLICVGLLFSCSLAVTPPETMEEKEIYQAPVTPANLTVAVDYAGGSVNLSWDPVDGAGYYTVYYQTDEDALQSEHEPQKNIVTTNSASFSIDRGGVSANQALTPNKIYRFAVSSTSSLSHLESVKSNEVFASTLSSFEFTPPGSDKLYYSLSTSGTLYNRQNRLVDPSFTIEFFSDSQMSTYATTLDGTPIALNRFNMSVWDSAKEKKENYTYQGENALVSNTQYFYRVVMYVQGVEISRQEGSFITDPSNTAPAVTNVNVIGNLANELEIRFVAPIINPGKEGLVERRFCIYRTSENIESLVIDEQVDPKDCMDITENENGTVLYVYHDKGVASGESYSYRIVSYYRFLDQDNYVIGDATDNTADCHPLSIPQILETSFEPVNDEKTIYAVDIEFNLPFGIEEKSEFILEYVDNADPEQKTEELEIEKLEDLGNDRYSVSSSVKLTETEAEATHYFVFTLRHQIQDEISSGASTIALPTQPTKENAVEFFSDFDASDNTGDGVLLTWAYKTNVGYPESDIKYAIYRSTSPIFSENDILVDRVSDPSSGSYLDDTAEPGVSYYYTLRATFYVNSVADVFTMSSDIGNRLDIVSELKATQGMYTDHVEISWLGVEGASGYHLYVSEIENQFGDDYIDIPSAADAKNYKYEYEITKDSGRTMYFKVVPYDIQNKEGVSSICIEGNSLGPYPLNQSINVTRNEYGDMIALSWEDVPGAMQYRISVYYSDEENSSKLLTTAIVEQGIGNFLFYSDDPALEAVSQYPLSREYGFSIEAMYEATAAEHSEIVWGTWVQPPRGISASKGEYNDVVKVEWEPVDGATYYRVYRRVVGESRWTDTNTTSSTNSVFDFVNEYDKHTYEYSVASVCGTNIVGQPQEYFPDAESNIGLPLYAPQNVRIIQKEYNSPSDGNMDEDIFEIQFDENKYATSYIVYSDGYDRPYEFELGENDSLVLKDPGDTSLPISGRIEDGVVILSVKRPILKQTPYFTFELYCRNSSSGAESVDATSYSSNVNLIASRIYPLEVVNLVNTALSSVLHEIDAEWKGDWAVSDRKYYSNTTGTVSVSSSYYSFPNMKDGAIELSGYSSSSVTLTGDFSFSTDYGYSGQALTWGDDPFQSLKSNSPLSVTLPYDLGIAKVTYNSVDVKNESGSYSVELDTNGDGIVDFNGSFGYNDPDVELF